MWQSKREQCHCKYKLIRFSACATNNYNSGLWYEYVTHFSLQITAECGSNFGIFELPSSDSSHRGNNSRWTKIARRSAECANIGCWRWLMYSCSVIICLTVGKKFNLAPFTSIIVKVKAFRYESSLGTNPLASIVYSSVNAVNHTAVSMVQKNNPKNSLADPSTFKKL